MSPSLAAMARQFHTVRASVDCRETGFSLPEILVAVAVLGLCASVSVVPLLDVMARCEARGAAQDWQAAAAWAQVGVLWHGDGASITYGAERLAVAQDSDLCGGNLGAAAPSVPVSANVNRWISGEEMSVRFLGPSASPDGGGSLFFDAGGTSYRVIVRPESGLTARTWVRDRP